ALELAAGETSNFGELFRDWMRSCYHNVGVKMVERTEQVGGKSSVTKSWIGPENQKNLLRYGLSVLRQSLLQQEQLPVQTRRVELDFITRFAAQLNPEKIAAISGELE